jgi:hypothetical protein
MKQMNVSILGLSETRWKGSGASTFDEGKFIYSGGSCHERGVGMLLNAETSKCLDAFSTVSDRVLLIMMGDLNAKVGSERVQDIVGPHGLQDKNERGERLIDWCITNYQIITNTLF